MLFWVILRLMIADDWNSGPGAQPFQPRGFCYLTVALAIGHPSSIMCVAFIVTLAISSSPLLRWWSPFWLRNTETRPPRLLLLTNLLLLPERSRFSCLLVSLFFYFNLFKSVVIFFQQYSQNCLFFRFQEFSPKLIPAARIDVLIEVCRSTNHLWNVELVAWVGRGSAVENLLLVFLLEDNTNFLIL